MRIHIRYSPINIRMNLYEYIPGLNPDLYGFINYLKGLSDTNFFEKQGDMFRPGCVADFMLEKDSLFAQVTLDDDELRLYQQVYNQLQLDMPVPDLVIYLQAPVAVLLERIRRRGIHYEHRIEREYLQALADAYTRFFYHYAEAPLLVVNAAEINFVDSDEDFAALLEHIGSIRRGRHFFNPLTSQP